MGDVLATVSDKRMAGSYVKPGLPGSPARIATWKPIVVSAHDYYPFGQYMPGRYRMDTTTSCLTTTETEYTNSTYYTTGTWQVAFEMNMISQLNGGNYDYDGSDSILKLQTNAPEDGLSLPLTGLTPGTAYTQSVSVSDYKGVYELRVIDDADSMMIGVTRLEGQARSGVFSVDFVPKGTSVHMTLVSADNGGNVSLTGMTTPHDTILPTTVVTTVCNGEHYPYGFNGQMKTNEWAGVGNSYEFKHRGYDPRIARFRSIDPIAKQYPWNAPYNFAEDRVIEGKDLEGLEYVGFGIGMMYASKGQTSVRQMGKELMEGFGPAAAAVATGADMLLTGDKYRNLYIPISWLAVSMIISLLQKRLISKGINNLKIMQHGH